MIDFQIKLLESLIKHWEQYAEVKKINMQEEKILLEKEKPDFPVQSLVFYHHPLWLQASVLLQEMVISSAFILHQQKMMAIKQQIVMPLCDAIIQNKIRLLQKDAYKQVAAQIMIDQSYHLMQGIKACQQIKDFRQLPGMQHPPFEMMRQLNPLLQLKCSSQYVLTQLAAAISAELLISTDLCMLSCSPIQPFCHFIFAADWRDERRHASIFALFARQLFPQLSKRDQQFFCRMMLKVSTWFHSTELAVWQRVLKQLHFPQADRMLNECHAYTENAVYPEKLLALIKSFNKGSQQP